MTDLARLTDDALQRNLDGCQAELAKAVKLLGQFQDRYETAEARLAAAEKERDEARAMLRECESERDFLRDPDA